MNWDVLWLALLRALVLFALGCALGTWLIPKWFRRHGIHVRGRDPWIRLWNRLWRRQK